MFPILFLLFTLLPLIELYLLFQLGYATSFWFAFGLVILTGIIGAALARQQGAQAYNRIQKDLHAGRMPADSLTDGVMILVAGVLLITPGMLTDAFGFSLLIPPVRRAMKVAAARYFKNRLVVRTGQSTPQGWQSYTWSSGQQFPSAGGAPSAGGDKPDIIDAEFRHVKEEEPKLGSHSTTHD